MIPLTLEIKNFLSYGPTSQTIDFTPYHLICLSGKNGFGKSALLDALTWALWGQARKVPGAAKADDGLLRLGQTQMMVALTFMFGTKKYRVRREFSKTYGKPYAALDFELFDEQAERFISLTDKTIRATQAKIHALMGLDYETFVNSAFIRQGQSNEFSKKSAKERKQILSTILGLSKYDSLQQAALDTIRSTEQEKKTQLALLEQVTTQLTTVPALTDEQTQLTTALTTLQASITSKQLELTQCQQALAVCRDHVTHAQALTQQRTTKQQLLAPKYDQLRALIATWRTVLKQATNQPPLDTLLAAKAKISNTEQALMQAHQQLVTASNRSMQLKQELMTRAQVLQKEHDALLTTTRTKLHQQELELKQLSVQRQEREKTRQLRHTGIAAITKLHSELERGFAGTQNYEHELASIKQQFEKRRAYYQLLVQRGNWARQARVDLEKKQLVVHDNSNPACPLCEQLLSAKRKQFLAEQFTQQDSFLAHRLTQVSTLLGKLKALLVAQHETVTALTLRNEKVKHQLLQRSELEKQLAVELHEQNLIEIELAQLMVSEHQLSELVARDHATLTQLEQQYQTVLASDLPTQQAQQELAQLQEIITKLAWDDAAYTALATEKQRIDLAIQQYHELQQAHAQQHERRRMITELCSELKREKAACTQLETAIAGHQQAAAQESAQNTQLQALLAELETAMAQKDALTLAMGKITHELARLAALEQSIQGRKQQITRLEDQIETYQQLATAFGKNGIQALLIEEAIPEIEQEANHLLSRLTDNQAQIFIESLRDLKSGGVKETLDIHITDTAGMRPYEMYSGGEAFRVDFSLRIAIAKLLARRAGTALQTLIIDEGFGSQDEEGLAHIMDALYAIQQDFSKIIIVSHLPEFKHNFPVHFVVEKGSSGSSVRVEERG